ncbi:hypothetical protein SETIT_9G509500v2 [Setaria italica]|uniref:Uncharacterized protein n=2 Tax=Setaria TaxID=4554 RepID=A0A368SUM9_SETIT|nr:hypothetical protein SETIT_9G509500v2 [Setaria italica]TKV97721.1 hypothetical protein SEVIR_9G513800v2 [Setaria viridis]
MTSVSISFDRSRGGAHTKLSGDEAALAALRRNVHVLPQPGGADVASHRQPPLPEPERADVHLHGDHHGEPEREVVLGPAERLVHGLGRVAVVRRPAQHHAEVRCVLAAVRRLPDVASGERRPVVEQPRRPAPVPQRRHLVRVHRREEEVVVRARRPGLAAHGEPVDGEARDARPQHDEGDQDGGAQQHGGRENRAERARHARGARGPILLLLRLAAAARVPVALGEVRVLGGRDAVYLVLLDPDDVHVVRGRGRRGGGGGGFERRAERGGDRGGGRLGRRRDRRRRASHQGCVARAGDLEGKQGERPCAPTGGHGFNDSPIVG